MTPVAASSAVGRAVEGLRQMILNRSVLPGEQIRQAEMAERLNISRVPLREALKVLETEGALVHSPNQGYFVAKLRALDLSQIYLMRQLLETELLKSLEWPTSEELQRMVAANRSMQDAIARSDVEDLVTANRVFHFHIFELSPLNLVRKEVERLWSLSESYRSVYLYDRGSRERISQEHERLIQALTEHDRLALVSISDLHRSGLQRYMAGLLGDNRLGEVAGSGSKKKDGT